ncbi:MULTISPECIES: hypothetical protein [Lonsdalea]|uniref:hypothetical protein n=1 Tax=Lonsdalea TaxID=1082702 RepID=UPI001301FDD4|nr:MULTISPECIES: hypothetical protein [Lonsdalea]QPQ25962.1 hypothetical protein I6N93_16295 [Lonsdalea populi]
MNFIGPHNRLDGYIEVTANPQAPPEDKSYALYRAIYGYSLSGYNSCGSACRRTTVLA